MRNLRTLALGALAIIGLGAAFSAAQTIRNPLRYIPPPSTFYVATTGSDGNKCTAGAPCLTIAHAIQYVTTQYDFQGSDITISVGAGTFSGGQITVTGANPGAASNNFAGGLKIIGAGKASTTIQNTTCAGGNNTFQINDGAKVGVGSATLITTCGLGSNLVAFNKSTVYLADADVKFGTAAYSRVIIYQNSAFNSFYPFEIASGGFYAFAGLNNSVFLFGPVTVTLTGTPHYSVAFVDVINGSLFADGGSIYSGTSTGLTYAINNSATIDREAATIALPGSALGILGYNSSYTPSLAACMGGSVGCSMVTTPTGLGTGGTGVLVGGAGAHMGTIQLNAGSAATGTSGSVYVGLPVQLQNGSCIVNAGVGTATWEVGTVFQAEYDQSGGNPFLLAQWYNGGVALAFGTDYRITYVCGSS